MGMPDTAPMWGKREDMVVRGSEPYNAEPPAAVLARADITPTDAFYVRNHGPIPDIAPERWQLTVNGLVDRPLTLTYQQLTTEFDQYSVTATLACAGNRRVELLRVRPIPGKDPWAHGAISTAEWRGVRLADILEAAGVVCHQDRDEALHVAFEAPDVAQVRVVVPGYVGARSVKWVTAITVQNRPSTNYFQAYDYRILPPGADADTVAPGEGISLSTIALNCDILYPTDGDQVASGELTIRGYGIAGDGHSVERIDVSLDDGLTWQQADLHPARSRWSWRPWSLTVEVAPGPLNISARAWDDTGALQPESVASLWNPRGYGNNAWARIASSVR